MQIFLKTKLARHEKMSGGPKSRQLNIKKFSKKFQVQKDRLDPIIVIFNLAPNCTQVVLKYLN